MRTPAWIPALLGALVLMLLSALGTWAFFKWRNWL